MKESKEKKCPHCESDNIEINVNQSTGHYDNNGKLYPYVYIATCKNCNKEFIYFSYKKNKK